MSRAARYLVRIKEVKQWYLILIGLVLAAICLALYINLGVMLSDSSSQQINTTNTTNIALDHVCLTTPVNRSIKCIDYTFESATSFTDYGHSLSNTVFMNYNFLVRGNGCVTLIHFQLFKPWKGDSQLSIFVVQQVYRAFEIRHRYSITPNRLTANWQTISIPDNVLPVRPGNLIGVGMDEYDDNKNEIYAIHRTFGLRGLNITRHTVNFSMSANYNHSVAFRFTTYSPSTIN